MAYHFEKNESGGQDLVIDGFEKGIAASPHQGIANIQNANISTEMGEVMASFGRIQQSQVAGDGVLIPIDNDTVSFTGVDVLPGTWIHILVDSGTGLSGNYYYLGNGQISTTYNGTPVNNIIVNTNLQEIFLTSGTSWVVPADFGQLNTIECIGAGGGGAGGSGGAGAGSGAGGGGYSKITNLTLTPGASITYAIGAAGTGGVGATNGTDGGDTYFNGASLGASSVGAQGGKKGLANQPQSGGLGGAAASGVGTTKFSGGNGGASNGGASGGAGSGGAAGPNGAGGNGQAVANNGGNGGQGDNGFGGVGGQTGVGNGGNGTEWVTHGSGGGGAGESAIGGGAGGSSAGLYGAGGGAGTNASGGSPNGVAGSQGVIRITYYPSTPITTSATFSVFSIGEPYQSATEPYFDSSGNQQYRYYILDKTGLIWVHDTAIVSPTWFLPDASTFGSTLSGLAVINGWLAVGFGGITPGSANAMEFKSTSLLGSTFMGAVGSLGTRDKHFSLVGKQGKLYVTDGTFIASYFPNTSLITGAANIQSYASYTAVTTTGTISALIGGAYPVIPGTTTRVPVVFFTGGTLPSAITTNTVYYIKWLNSGRTFEVYAAASGGSAIDIQTGAVGTQYFNTFYPVDSAGSATAVYTAQRLNLPFYEFAQCLAEVGNTILIGCLSNSIFPWNQVSVLPQGFIPLPENNTTSMITVKNNAYILAGQKGNIYVSNGASVSLAISVPDYCAGISGTPSSYIEPYFTWGGAMYMRGRVWFSILDQTSIKTGNCGGIWSFIPETEQASLRLENQSSYGTYNGYSPVLLPSQIQTAIGPQYWTGWVSNITTPTYGIDFSDNVPTAQTIIETDLIPTGTVLQQKTFTQIEYKLAAPLAAGEAVEVFQRPNGIGSFSTLGPAVVETTTSFSGYFQVNFQKGQWVQFQIRLTPLSSDETSFVRLKQLRLR